MHTVSPNLEGISETLLIPLYFRALETRRSDALFNDPLAVELVSRIEYDFSGFEGYDLLQTVVACRVQQLDRCVQAFIEYAPKATVINIGCGLDTRFQRLDNGLLHWYELDLPKVVTLRRHFFEEKTRYRFIAGSVLDLEWTEELEISSEKGLLLLAEGLFPYFKEDQLVRIIRSLKQRFPGAVLIFDAVSPFQVELSRHHPALNITDARFNWGLDRAGDIEDWEAGVRLLFQTYYLDKAEQRLGWYNMLRMFPFVRYGFSIVAYGLGTESAMEELTISEE